MSFEGADAHHRQSELREESCLSTRNTASNGFGISARALPGQPVRSIALLPFHDDPHPPRGTASTFHPAAIATDADGVELVAGFFGGLPAGSGACDRHDLQRCLVSGACLLSDQCAAPLYQNLLTLNPITLPIVQFRSLLLWGER